MKILLSCDENPYYYDFWPYARDIWKKRIGADPKLILINDNKNTNTFDSDGILYVQKIEEIPVHLQAQLARIYYTKYFPNEICVVSDIDMFPVSTDFFNLEKIKSNCDENTFFHLNPETREFGQFPLCYYCGYGSLYERLFFGLSWEQFLHEIIEKDFNTDKFKFSLPPSLQGKKLWFSDEIFLHTQIQKENIKISINNELVGSRRLDRGNIVNFNLSNLLRETVVDIHLPRPAEDYRSEIERIFWTLTM